MKSGWLRPASDMAPETWTVGSLLDWTEGYFARGGIEDPRTEAEFLLSFLLACGPLDLRVNRGKILAEKELNRFREMVRQRRDRIPYAHITGEREFMGFRFRVTPDTLIPRPDTEHVVYESVRLLEGNPDAKVADLGTGTGCIAVSIARLSKAGRIYAVDISPATLAVAQKNIAALGCAAVVSAKLGNLFEALAWEPGEGSLDLVVSNPPYIPAGEIAGLQPEVLREPVGALDGGPDGLDYYRRIASGAKRFLKAGGYIVFELNSSASAQIRAIVEAEGFGTVKMRRDYGGHERVLSARLNKD